MKILSGVYKTKEYEGDIVLNGEIQNFNSIRDSESKGIAFAQMPNGKHAKAAIEALNGSQYDGRTLKVSIAKRRDSVKEISNVKDAQVEEVTDPVQKGRTMRRRTKGLKVLLNHLGK